MALGSMLRRVALPVAPRTPIGPNSSTNTGRSTTRTIITDASNPYSHERSAGQTLLAQINALRATYGFLPTAMFAGLLGVPGAWKATKFYANTLGAMPFLGYADSGDGVLRRLNPTPLFLSYPSGSRRTPFLVKSSAAIDAIWHGNAIGVVVSRRDGWPDAWIGVPADWVGVAWVDPGADLPAGARVYQIGSMTFAQHDILHFQMPGSPGALRGLGVLETQVASLGLAQEQESQAYSVARDSGVPTGILSIEDPDATDGEIKQVKADWLESQRLRTIAALGHNTKFQPIAWSPEAGQMVEARQFTLTQVENSFELPTGYLGGAQRTMTYANRETDMANMLNTSWLAGGIPVFEETFTAKMAPRTLARANLDAVLRPDAKTRAEIHAIALGPNGWAVRDEVRAQEDERPLGGKDGDGAAWKTPPKPPAPIKATATVDKPIEGVAE